jgi:flagellar protein FlgJ
MISGLRAAGDQSLVGKQMETGAQTRGLNELDALRAGNRGGTVEAQREALREASRQFEAVFLNQMLKAMRETVGDGGLIKKSQGEEVFQGMLDEEWSKSLAGRHGSRGLNEVLYRQLARQMGIEEETVNPPAQIPTAVASPQATHPLLLERGVMPLSGVVPTIQLSPATVGTETTER